MFNNLEAHYTIRLHEILQRSEMDIDLMDIDEVIRIGKSTIFHNMDTFLPEQYKDEFIAGFILHYLDNEIGFETVTRWQTALMEKLINNKDYINLIYDNLDKQVFSNYRLHKSNTKSTSNVEQDTTSNKGIIKDTLESDSKTKTDVNSQSETDNNITNTTSNDGDVTTTNTGTTKNVSTTNNTSATSSNYTDTNTQSGSKTTTSTIGNITSTNKDQYSDTPQNGLSAVISGTYLTNARYTENSQGAHTDTHKDTYDGFKSTTSRVADAASNKTTNTGSDDNTRTDNLEAKTTDKSKSTTTQTGGTTSSDNTSSETEGSSTNTNISEQTKDSTQSTTGTNEGESDTKDETYELNYEMLIKSEPLMNKLWNIFDDLFMQIYDSYIY